MSYLRDGIGIYRQIRCRSRIGTRRKTCGLGMLFSGSVNVSMHSRRNIAGHQAKLWKGDGDLPPPSAGRPKKQGLAEVGGGMTVLLVSKLYSVGVTTHV